MSELENQKIIDQFMEISRIPGESKNERPIIDYLKEFLAKHGFDFQEDRSLEFFDGDAGNLICKIPGKRRSKTPLLLSAHVDTIAPTCQRPQIVDGKIVSSDERILGADDRVGVTVLLEILKKVARGEIDYPDLEVVFLVAEEIGLVGSTFLDYELLSAKQGVNFDCSAPVGHVVLSAPTAIEFTVQFLGKEAHSAVNPESGVHAIAMAAEAITSYQLPQKKNETVFNVGRITGGRANNVIPGWTEITGEIRSFAETHIQHYLGRIQTVTGAVTQKHGGQFRMNHEYRYHTFSLTPDQPIVRVVQEAYQKTGIKFQPIRYMAGSDANNFNRREIATVNVGLGYHENHSSREYIEIDDLIRDVKVGIQIVHTAAQVLDPL